MDHILLIFLPPLYMAEILPISGLNFSFFLQELHLLEFYLLCLSFHGLN